MGRTERAPTDVRGHRGQWPRGQAGSGFWERWPFCPLLVSAFCLAMSELPQLPFLPHIEVCGGEAVAVFAGVGGSRVWQVAGGCRKPRFCGAEPVGAFAGMWSCERSTGCRSCRLLPEMRGWPAAGGSHRSCRSCRQSRCARRGGEDTAGIHAGLHRGRGTGGSCRSCRKREGGEVPRGWAAGGAGRASGRLEREEGAVSVSIACGSCVVQGTTPDKTRQVSPKHGV
jgi:hypothetical protein